MLQKPGGLSPRSKGDSGAREAPHAALDTKSLPAVMTARLLPEKILSPGRIQVPRQAVSALSVIAPARKQAAFKRRYSYSYNAVNQHNFSLEL